MNQSAAERIRNKERNQLFRKEGRKYIPVADHYECDGWRDGWHLVKIHKGVSKRTTLHPDRAEFDAAMKDNVENIVPIIREVMDFEPKRKDLPPETIRAWKRFIKKWGDDFRHLQGESIYGMAEKIVEALSKKD